MTLGNDFAGTIVAAGKGCEQALTVGDRVYGVKPVSRDGSHTSHLLVKGAYARKAPPSGNIQNLAVLPYSFVTMWLAAKAAGLTRDNVRGKTVLVHGAAGGLGTLALQTLSAWGAKVTAIAKGARPPCLLRRRRDRSDRPQPKSIRDLEGRVRRHAQLRHMERRVKVALLSAAGRAWPRDDRSSVDSKFRRPGLDRRRRPDDEPKKADTGDSAERDRAITHGFCSSRRRKRFPKWLGSSSKDGSLFRSGLRRRFATSMPPSIMFDFVGADGRSWSYDLGPLTAVEDSHGFRSGGSQAVGVIRMPLSNGAEKYARARRRGRAGTTATAETPAS